MNITGNHWTIRWYRHYVKLGGFGRDPENLCRFLRVITVWAPLRWLFIPAKKGQLPPIVAFIFSVSFLFLFCAVFGAAAVNVRDTYVNEGLAGFKPDPLVIYVFVGLLIFAAAALISSGLWRLYHEWAKNARSGAFCPFIEIDGGMQLPVKVEPAAEPDFIEEIMGRLESEGIRSVLSDYRIQEKSKP